jgi:hypothetical protein
MKPQLKWIALGLALAHCGSRAEPPAPPQPKAAPIETATAPPSAAAPAAPAAATRLRPPQVPFKQPEPWQSRKKDQPPIPPPDVDQEVWRAFVNQNQPIQIKTPVWQLLPPKETVELAMPAVSKFACAVGPLSVVSDANDFNTKLKGWVLTRPLYCSDDGWHSWTEYGHGVKIGADGTRQMLDVPQALLREREADSSVRETYVLLRSDKERREATTGPPRVVPGMEVDED